MPSYKAAYVEMPHFIKIEQIASTSSEITLEIN